MKTSFRAFARPVCAVLFLSLISNLPISVAQTQESGEFKMSAELQLLARDIGAPTRSGGIKLGDGMFTKEQLSTIFGIDTSSNVPRITVSLTVSSSLPSGLIERLGGSPITSYGDKVIASLPVQALGQLSRLKEVTKIKSFTSPQVPSPVVSPQVALRPVTRSASTLQDATAFESRGLTGKGVIVGIIDSGIDWKHEDFIRADGTSRVLFLWDLTDDSFQRSGGKIGAQPPLWMQGNYVGTLYSKEQIDSALRGQGVVNSRDGQGHGTAVAGVAASNGRGSPRGQVYKGVAPESDLIIVKASDCGGFKANPELASEWIFRKASELGRPAVVNMSFGSMFSTRDGSSASEEFLDSLLGPENPGRAVTVAAGNEARGNYRASARFGKRNQPDADGNPVSARVRNRGIVLALFDTKDDWGLQLVFKANDGTVKSFQIEPPRNKLGLVTVRSDSLKQSEIQSIERRFTFESEAGSDRVVLHLPADRGTEWLLVPYGASDSVVSGRADFYSITEDGSVFFGDGVEKSQIVASPGNSTRVITVGSHVARTSWLNKDGTMTSVNQKIGAISDFSSIGFRRDGVVKPDFVAPGQNMISPLSADASSPTACDGSMAKTDTRFIAIGEKHVVWDGTSASAPFLAGVIALMLEKNPKLTSTQIHSILKRSARSGGEIGPVPNPSWGWGAVDVTRALTMTPLPTAPRPRPRR